MNQISDVLRNDDMTGFAYGVEDKVLENGFLTERVGHPYFNVTINFESSIIKDDEVINIILTINVDEPTNIDDVDIRHIEKFIVRYVKSKGLKDILKLYNDNTKTKSRNLIDIPIVSEVIIDNCWKLHKKAIILWWFERFYCINRYALNAKLY